VQRANRLAGVHAVLHLAHGPERAVEAELVRDRLHDLLQRRRHDVHLLAPLTVLFDEMERLRVDERLQDRLHRLRDELAHLLGREAAQEDEPVLGGLAHGLVVGAAQDEEELPGRGLRQLAPRDHAVLPERACERERGRPAKERAVEIEERRRCHYVLSPAAVSASSRRG
jgi:hypothetical protein